MPLEITTKGTAVQFTARIQPGARRSEIAGEYGSALKIRIAAPPLEGRANEALCRFLAKCLNVPASAVKIAAGEQSRTKRIEVRGATPEQIRALANSATAK